MEACTFLVPPPIGVPSGVIWPSFGTLLAPTWSPSCSKGCPFGSFGIPFHGRWASSWSSWGSFGHPRSALFQFFLTYGLFVGVPRVLGVVGVVGVGGGEPLRRPSLQMDPLGFKWTIRGPFGASNGPFGVPVAFQMGGPGGKKGSNRDPQEKQDRPLVPPRLLHTRGRSLGAGPGPGWGDYP